MYIGLNVKYPLLLLDFNGTVILSTDILKIHKFRRPWKSVHWEPRYSIRTDRLTWSEQLLFRNFPNEPKTNKIHTIKLKYRVLWRAVSYTIDVLMYIIKDELKWSSNQEYKTVSDDWVAEDSAGGIGQAAVIVKSSSAPRRVANQVIIKRCVCRNNPSSKSENTDFFHANNSWQIKNHKRTCQFIVLREKKRKNNDRSMPVQVIKVSFCKQTGPHQHIGF